MRTPHVAPAAAYECSERAPVTHTILISDERDEQGSATTWTFPMGLPQSMGLAVVSLVDTCLLYTSPSPRDLSTSRMPSSA